jgi:succinate-semialdehyde dehydrogenase/glutarate-semialdehyde dehydrogenase
MAAFHPAVRALTFTGSSAAGRELAAAAGAALRPCVLELGGSDAYVVLADADLPLAARICAEARLTNAGQSCIAAKRFIVVETVRQEFEERLVAEMATSRIGNPLEESTGMGPLARADLRAEVHSQVTRSTAAGATCLLGGRIPAGPGCFYPATVLTDVTPGMAAFDEEIFGPVAAIVSARDEVEAIDLANQTAYGLGAAVFTRDIDRGLRIAARELEAGNCFVNAQVRSDPRLPSGNSAPMACAPS